MPAWWPSESSAKNGCVCVFEQWHVPATPYTVANLVTCIFLPYSLSLCLPQSRLSRSLLPLCPLSALGGVFLRSSLCFIFLSLSLICFALSAFSLSMCTPTVLPPLLDLLWLSGPLPCLSRSLPPRRPVLALSMCASPSYVPSFSPWWLPPFLTRSICRQVMQSTTSNGLRSVALVRTRMEASRRRHLAQAHRFLKVHSTRVTPS